MTLVACSHTPAKRRAAPNTSTTAATAVTSSTAGAPSTTAQNGPPPCTTAQLDIQIRRTGGAASHGGVDIIFTNRGPARCKISGYPGVRALDGAGHAITDATRTPRGYLGGLPAGTTELPIVELRPNEKASALVEGTVANPAANGAPCPDVETFVLTPPGETHSVRRPVHTSYSCDLGVHPVLPGESGKGES